MKLKLAKKLHKKQEALTVGTRRRRVGVSV